MRIEDPESGRITVLDPVRPERPAEAWAGELKADKVKKSAVCREQGWTESDFHEAEIFGFPKPIDRAGSRRWVYGVPTLGPHEPVYSRAQIAEWLATGRRIFAAE